MCGIFYIHSVNAIDLQLAEQVCAKYIDPRGPDVTSTRVSDNSFYYTSVLPIHKTTHHVDDVQFVGELFDLTPDTDEVEYLKRVDPRVFVDFNHNGMYSILWHRKNTVLATSDPQGERRLFYYKDSDTLMISSVPGAIARMLVQPSISRPSLKRYLSQKHHILTDGCMIEGIYELPRGLWEYDKRTLSFDRIKTFDYTSWKSSSDVVDALKTEIDRMKQHEGMANVACTISGGIDSSTVAYIYKPQHTFALRFVDKNCTASLSEVLSHKVGSNHRILDVTVQRYAESALRCIDLMAGVMPTHSMASMHYLGKKVRESGFTVLYGGDGADELLLGYPYYQQPSAVAYSDVLSDNHSLSYDSVYASQFDLLSDNETKRQSLYDYFFQCGSCQFASADIAISDSGVEYRTPFGRKPVASSSFGLPADVLLKGQLGKAPLVKFFKDSFGIQPLPKTGFAGYPNELKYLVQDITLTEEEQKLFDETSSYLSERDYEWKLVNYKLFKKVYNVQL